MAILAKGTTFADGDQVTSTKLNNLVDNATFVAGSSGTTDDATLQVVGNQLSVKTIQTGNIAAAAITESKLATDSVTTAKIKDSTGASDGITTAKIATGAVTESKIADNAVTNAKMADDSVDTAEIVDAAITAPKLDGAQTGSAPVYGIRAWAKLNTKVGSSRTGAYKTGTYSRTATETTVSGMTNHGLKQNDVIRLNFTSGSGTNGLYTVTSVISTSSFVVAHSGTATSGNVEAQFIQIQASGNISTATWYDSGDSRFVVNFNVPMPNDDYASAGFGHHYPGAWGPGQFGEDSLGTTQLNTVNQAYFYQQYDNRFCSVIIVG
jgi:hypothetical protein